MECFDSEAVQIGVNDCLYCLFGRCNGFNFVGFAWFCITLVFLRPSYDSLLYMNRFSSSWEVKNRELQLHHVVFWASPFERFYMAAGHQYINIQAAATTDIACDWTRAAHLMITLMQHLYLLPDSTSLQPQTLKHQTIHPRYQYGGT